MKRIGILGLLSISLALLGPSPSEASEGSFVLSWKLSSSPQLFDYRTCPGNAGTGVTQERFGFSTKKLTPSGATTQDFISQHPRAEFSQEEAVTGLARGISEDIIQFVEPVRDLGLDPVCPMVRVSRKENGFPGDERMEFASCRSLGNATEALSFTSPSQNGFPTPIQFAAGPFTFDSDQVDILADELLEALAKTGTFGPIMPGQADICPALKHAADSWNVSVNNFSLSPDENVLISGSAFLLQSRKNPDRYATAVYYIARYERVVQCN